MVDTPAAEEHWVERLERLGKRHQSGPLDTPEFAALKARLIAETTTNPWPAAGGEP